MQLVEKIEQQSQNKTSELTDTLITLRTETQKLIAERTKALADSSEHNLKKAFALIAELERKLESRFQQNLEAQQRQHSHEIEETKEGAAKLVSNLDQNLSY